MSAPFSEIDVARVLRDHPRLTDHGFGLCDVTRLAPAEREAEFDRERARLRAAYPAVIEVAEWLSATIGKTAAPRGDYPPYSYDLKHIAEGCLGRYVSNGELIAAALLGGYPVRERSGPNAEIGMSKRDVEAARRASR